MMDNFYKYYNQWKEETRFLSVGNFDNDNFRALCDPEKVSFKELIEGSGEILNDRDDFIVHALDIQSEKYLGKPLFEYEGYVPLEDSCNAWRVVIELLNMDENLYEEFKKEAAVNLNKYFTVKSNEI